MVLTLLLDRAGGVIAPLESASPPAVGDTAAVGAARYRVVAVRRGGRWWYATCEEGEGMIEVSGGYGTASTPPCPSCGRYRAELTAVWGVFDIACRQREELRAERDQLAAELAAARAGRERLRGLLRGGFGMSGLYGGGDRGCPPRARPDVGTYKPLDFDSK